MSIVPMIIDGEEVTTGSTFADIDPSTGQVISEIARAGTAEIDAAVAAARRCFEQNRRSSATSRSKLLGRFAETIRKNAERLAEMESQDVGKPLRQARNDVEVCAKYFDFYAGILLALHGDTLPTIDGMVAFTRREPFGVTAHITPWNYPLQMVARTIAPALAAGNCCIVKPAEDTPRTAVELARLALLSGFPAGMFNVVNGFGIDAGAALSAHPGIDHIAFTGSRPVGTAIATAAAQSVVPVVLELGGKSPNVVFGDADLDLAVPLIVNAITQNAGQTCSAGSRLLVHESVQAEVIQRIADRFNAFTLAPGIADADMGPLINAKQRDRVAQLVEDGKNDGTLVAGGYAPTDGKLGEGFFFRPTLFNDVPPTAVIAQEEVFGPVLVATSFRTEEEAIALANGTEFGLVAAVWTSDVGRAHRVAEEIRSGQVFVNTYGAAGGVELPFGGWKRSGYGREKGFEALVGYTQTKTIVIGI